MGQETQLQDFLDHLVATGSASAVVGLVGDASGTLWQGVAGEERPGVPARVETVFDFASLTKVFAATLALVLDASGRLPLRTPLGAVFPRAPHLRRKTLESLLRHRSGIAAWVPLYHLCRGQDRHGLYGSLLAPDLWTAAGPLYSDPGYIVWASAAETREGRPLFELLREFVLGPLGIAAMPPPGDRPGVALNRMGTGMEVRLARGLGLAVGDLGPPPAGMPQDGNARFLYDLGVPLAGHAGLFGTAGDLYRLGAEWLAPRRVLHPCDVARALSGSGPFALGWWRRRVASGGGGRALSRRSFGLTGFAGGNLWVDPRAGRVYVLLASRVDPLDDFNSRRRRFHDIAAPANP